MPIADVHVHYFELTQPQFSPKFSPKAGLVFSRVDPPVPALNRFLYTAVGAQHFWIDRRPWTVDQWTALLARGDAIETWILSQDGVPAGYVEFETRADNAMEIVYIGLLREFIGDGRGAHLLSKAVERIFAKGATKVLLETCNLDHEFAIANYTARGFREVSSVVKQDRRAPAQALLRGQTRGSDHHLARRPCPDLKDRAHRRAQDGRGHRCRLLRRSHPK
jgi:ribosomal protein S18 acetylase RimI-like enzyme